jgi:hypothetical protein
MSFARLFDDVLGVRELRNDNVQVLRHTLNQVDSSPMSFVKKEILRAILNYLINRVGNDNLIALINTDSNRIDVLQSLTSSFEKDEDSLLADTIFIINNLPNSSALKKNLSEAVARCQLILPERRKAAAQAAGGCLVTAHALLLLMDSGTALAVLGFEAAIGLAAVMYPRQAAKIFNGVLEFLDNISSLKTTIETRNTAPAAVLR